MNRYFTSIALAALLTAPLVTKAQQSTPPVSQTSTAQAAPDQSATAAMPQQPAPASYPQQQAPAAYPQQAAPPAYPQQPAPAPYPQQAAPANYPPPVVPAQYTQQELPVGQAPVIVPNARIGDPNYYGQVDLVNNPPPPVVYSTPVIAQPAPPGVVYPPIYMRVPPMYYQNWPYYCGYYNACSYPVFFVQDSWYMGWYAPWYVRWYPHGRPGFVIRVGFQPRFVPHAPRPRGEWGHEHR